MDSIPTMVQYLSVRTDSSFNILILIPPSRKLFTLVMTLNITGIILTAAGVWHYPKQYMGQFSSSSLRSTLKICRRLCSG